MNDKFRVGIILDSTKESTYSHQIVSWLKEMTVKSEAESYVIIDIKEEQLSLVNQSVGSNGLIRFQEKIKSLDAAIFITLEYNHEVVSSLKHALLSSSRFWYKKVAGIISYGSSNGIRAIVHLKEVMQEVGITDVSMTVSLTLYEDFEDGQIFRPCTRKVNDLYILINQVNTWGKAALALR